MENNIRVEEKNVIFNIDCTKTKNDLKVDFLRRL